METCDMCLAPIYKICFFTFESCDKSGSVKDFQKKEQANDFELVFPFWL